MVANPKEVHVPYHTLEYFAIEGAGHARYEYWNGEIVCMSGGSEWHGVIGGNVYFTFQRTGGLLIWSAPTRRRFGRFVRRMIRCRKRRRAAAG